MRASSKRRRAQNAGGSELVCKQDVEGQTCLHYAAMHGLVHIVDCVLEVGGHELLFKKNEEGITAFFLAVQENRVAVVERLLQASAPEELLQKLLLDTGKDGSSCLFASVYQNNLDLARMLLIAGGRELALLQDATGSSCMHVAAADGHVHMVKLLLEFAGRDLVMLRQLGGTSCLLKASARGHAAVAGLLIDVGGITAGPKLLLGLLGKNMKRFKRCKKSFGYHSGNTCMLKESVKRDMFVY